MMAKSGKTKIVIGFIIFVAIILAGVLTISTINNNQRESEELAVRREGLSDQLFYARDMFFDSNMPGDFRLDFNWAGMNVRGGNVLAFMDQEVSDVVFVHSEAEAVGFSADVIVGWPSEYSAMLLERLNENTNLDVIIEGLDITLPLTLEDMVDNWEIMNEIWGERLHPSGVRVLRDSISEIRRGISEEDIDDELTEGTTD